MRILLAEFGDDPDRYTDARARNNYAGAEVPGARNVGDVEFTTHQPSSRDTRSATCREVIPNGLSEATTKRGTQDHQALHDWRMATNPIWVTLITASLGGLLTLADVMITPVAPTPRWVLGGPPPW